VEGVFKPLELRQGERVGESSQHWRDGNSGGIAAEIPGEIVEDGLLCVRVGYAALMTRRSKRCCGKAASCLRTYEKAIQCSKIGGNEESNSLRGNVIRIIHYIRISLGQVPFYSSLGLFRPLRHYPPLDQLSRYTLRILDRRFIRCIMQ
jgi:hypothetical protein